jgi:hypothetical protein
MVLDPHMRSLDVQPTAQMGRRSTGVCHLALLQEIPDIYMLGRHEGGKMDATTATLKLAESAVSRFARKICSAP